jgi:uncharacterized membrane protein
LIVPVLPPKVESSPPPITASRRLGLATRFALYGLAGLCLEVLFTSVTSQLDGTGDARFMGWSSLWMLPIWGCAFLTCDVMGRQFARRAVSWPVRAAFYVLVCFALEFLSGAAIRACVGRSPWDYSAARWSLRGLIRLDYAPIWAICGLGGERLASLLRRLRIARDE